MKPSLFKWSNEKLRPRQRGLKWLSHAGPASRPPAPSSNHAVPPHPVARRDHEGERTDALQALPRLQLHHSACELGRAVTGEHPRCANMNGLPRTGSFGVAGCRQGEHVCGIEHRCSPRVASGVGPRGRSHPSAARDGGGGAAQGQRGTSAQVRARAQLRVSTRGHRFRVSARARAQLRVSTRGHRVRVSARARAQRCAHHAEKTGRP